MRDDDPATAARLLTGSWKSAGFCGPNGGNCVEVNLDGTGFVGIRDSKAAPGRVLVFYDVEWREFLDSARAGRFDR